MFDSIINTVKGFAMNIVWFFVAGLVGVILVQLVMGGAIDIMNAIRLAVTAAVAGLTTSLVMGAVKGG